MQSIIKIFSKYCQNIISTTVMSITKLIVMEMTEVLYFYNKIFIICKSEKADRILNVCFKMNMCNVKTIFFILLFLEDAKEYKTEVTGLLK